ncbi:MAG: TonB family protein [Pseudomonadota bacterium]
MSLFTILVPLAVASSSVSTPPPPPRVVLPVPAISGDIRRNSDPLVLKLEQRSLICGGQPVTPLLSQEPDPAVLNGRVARRYHQADLKVRFLMLEFDINDLGQAVNIRSEVIPEKGALLAIWLPDAIPVLATWQFAKNQPREACQLQLALNTNTVADTDMATLIKLRALKLTSDKTARRQIARRIISPDATCLKKPRPRFLVRNSPDYLALSSNPGAINYVALVHDIDAEGRVINIRNSGNSGHAELNQAAEQSLVSNQYATSRDPARTGCPRYYKMSPKKTVTYAKPEEETAPAETCKGLPEDWIKKPDVEYPKNFLRRSIEGWAEIQFDVAPWGQVGNVSVLRAEPSTTIGDGAKRAIQVARKAASERGYTGCIEMVRFEMKKNEPDTKVSD